jgi:hypothetical protein
VEYINVIYVKLPMATTALTTPNEDNTWTVALNIDLPEEKLRKALLHELGHIFNRDFDSDDYADKIEYECNAYEHGYNLDDHVINYIV